MMIQLPSGMNLASSDVTVLLVEDNPVFAEQVISAVEKLPFKSRVIACACGGQALELIRNRLHSYDVALIDIELPDISGIEVIKALHQISVDLPMVVISVVTSEKIVLEAIRSGAKGFIVKSDSLEAISSAITDVLCGNYPISPSLARSLFKLAGAPILVDRQDRLVLSRREKQTLELIGKGNSYSEVAALMGVSLSTVQSHIRKLYKKLDSKSQVQALSRARALGIFPLYDASDA